MQKLRELRKQNKLTTTDLANIIGCSNPTITHYERGDRSPDPKTLLKLADYFKVSVDYLLGREGTPQWTAEERALGVQDTIMRKLTPEEDELLSDYREIGIKKGANAQALALKIVKQILEN